MQKLMPTSQGMASGAWDVVEVSSGGATAIRVFEGIRAELRLEQFPVAIPSNDQTRIWQGQLRVTNSLGVSEVTRMDLDVLVEALPEYVSRVLRMRAVDQAYADLLKAVSRYDGCISVSNPAVAELLAAKVVPFDGIFAVLVTSAFAAAVAVGVKLGEGGCEETWPLVDPMTGVAVKYVSPVRLYTEIYRAKLTHALGIAWQPEVQAEKLD